MKSIIEIKNNRKLVGLLISQIGEIIGIEAAVFICYFFLDINIIIFQLIVTPIIFILILSKYTRPVIETQIDKDSEIFIFSVLRLGINRSSIEIPFDKIRIIKKWKWLLNFYSEVIEIKNGNETRIVIPVKDNSDFSDQLLSEIEQMINLEIIDKKQIKI